MNGVSDAVRFRGNKRDGVSTEKCVEWMLGEGSRDVFATSGCLIETERVGLHLFAYS